MMDRAGGGIRAENRKGGGLTIVLQFPRALEEPAPGGKVEEETE